MDKVEIWFPVVVGVTAFLFLLSMLGALVVHVYQGLGVGCG